MEHTRRRPRPRRVILISGATGGIGREIVEELLALPEEHSLSLGVRDFEKARELFPEENPRLQFVQYDALDLRAPQKWVDLAIKQFGPITDLITCAGCSSRVDFMAGSLEGVLVDELVEEAAKKLEHDFKVNALGPWLMMQACLPHLAKMAPEMGDCTTNVINIGSRTGKRVRTRPEIKGINVGYAASKFALTGVNDAGAALCSKLQNGVRITMIAPSFVATEMSERSNKPVDDMIPAWFIGHDCAFLLGCPRQASFQHQSIFNGYEPHT